MVVVVAMALSLVLVVLAELYCTLLLRQRRRPNPPPTASNASPRHPISAPSLRSFYAQGVIRTPRSFLFHHQELASPESSTTDDPDQLMYICNPMYDKIMLTPLDTPATSPSHLDIEAGSSTGSGSGGESLPLSPMKKLPVEGASVALGDGPSIPSYFNTLDGGVTSSSSASASTSPSW